VVVSVLVKLVPVQLELNESTAYEQLWDTVVVTLPLTVTVS
jgi:hypothetical protein